MNKETKIAKEEKEKRKYGLLIIGSIILNAVFYLNNMIDLMWVMQIPMFVFLGKFVETTYKYKRKEK